MNDLDYSSLTTSGKTWRLKRAGIINFWFYDQQEFEFGDGRMLLRGANGSGKSVTMQSFIPLLLDGNRSPERLDPFGSTSRRLDTYMLSEDDKRDERTGYLYLELYHEPTGVSETIGMGIQARKNKPLNVWYFCLDSHWTVEENFSFYTSSQRTRVLNRLELRDAVGEQGVVFERQGDYMAEVNRRYFGFDSVQSYRELLNLLIQLRSPKLSKDFKPTVISEILSDSLEPLSDDDFRPLSQSIEHMDAAEANLTHLKGVLQAVERLSGAFSLYNSAFFKDKSQLLIDLLDQADQYENKVKKLKAQINEGKMQLESLQKDLLELNQEKAVLETQKEAVQQDDLLELMDQELKLKESIAELKDQLERKIAEVKRKEDNIKLANNRLRKEEDEMELIQADIDSDLADLDEFGELLAYSGHALFKREFTENREGDYSFAVAQRDQDQFYHELKTTQSAVQETSRAQKSYDHYQSIYDGQRIKYQKTESQLNRWENEFDRLKTEWKGLFRKWQESSRALTLSEDLSLEIEALVERIEKISDVNSIERRFDDLRNGQKLKYQTQLNQLENQLEKGQAEINQAQIELDQLKERGHVEPTTSPENIKSRQLLEELNIKFKPMYLALELSDDYPSEIIEKFEQVLKELGLLNALLVDPKDRDQVQSKSKNLSDNFIFIHEENWAELINDLNRPGEASSRKLESFLKNILTHHEADISVDLENGLYKIGQIKGIANINFPEAYLNKNRRQAYFERELYEARENINRLQETLNDLKDQIKLVNQALVNLEQDFSNKPDFIDLETALSEMDILNNQLKAISEQMKDTEKTLSKERDKYTKLYSRSKALTQSLQIDHSLDAVEEAVSLAQDYANTLQALSQRHKSYLTIKRSYQSQLESLENDRYDLIILIGEESNYERNLSQSQKALLALSERLSQDDSQELLAQLEIVTKRLSEIPEEDRELSAEIIKTETNLQYQEKDLAEAEVLKSDHHEKLELSYFAYCDELDLAYVYTDLNHKDDFKNELEKLIEGVKPDHKAALELVARELEIIKDSNRYKETTASLEHYSNRLVDSYYEQRHQLTDYGVVMVAHTSEVKDSEGEPVWERPDIKAHVESRQVDLYALEDDLKLKIESLENLVEEKDRELFEEIITDTISKKIRAKIFRSELWVDQMNELMAKAGEETTSGFALSLRWVYKDSQQEGELSSRELIDLLKMPAELMKDSDRMKLTNHFRRKINQARDRQAEEGNNYSFHTMIKEVLDYRKWFEFQLRFKKKGEQFRELTNNRFFALSGGEKAMAMYVPLFSAVVAKYNAAEPDAPRIISLDEAFAGIDEQNIREMFRYMVTFDFNFIINSQILWGDYDTVAKMNIYQLVRPNNEPYVTVIPHVWNGSERVPILSEPVQGVLDV